MSRSHPAPTRSLPDRANLAQLRKQAKELLKSYRAGDEAAAAEVLQFEQNADPASFALADAQRVLARTYGFPSWTAVKQHVEGVNITAFCKAVDAGDVVKVRNLARARPELVELSPDGEEGERVALHLAVLKRDAELTRVLMRLGSNARKGIWPHRSATTAHTIAKDRGYDEIVTIIEEEEERRRKEMSSSKATVSSKIDEIHKAILQDRNDEAIRFLESDLSQVGACNMGGATPLHIAAWAHNAEMAAWLLDHDAPVDARAPFAVPVRLHQELRVPGRTPLDYAAIVAGWAHAEHDSLFYFMENAHLDPARFHKTARLLLQKGAELTPRAAVAIGDVEAVLQMHRQGRLGNESHTLRGGLISVAVRVDRPEMVSLLLDLGLDHDEPVHGEYGRRISWGMPLWFASMCGRHEIAELLLARGADVNAIVYACGDSLCMAKDEKMQALLRKHGARLTVETVTDRKAAQAILDGTMTAYSLDVAEPTLQDLAEIMLGGSDPEIDRLCLAQITRRRDDPWWNGVLLKTRSPEGLKLILEHGVDPDIVNDAGYTILHHLASDYGHASNEEARVIRATILLDAGASLTKRDPLLQSTPLGWACRWGRIELVRLYLERGADPTEADAEPWATPLSWATKHGHHEIIELLRRHPAQ